MTKPIVAFRNFANAPKKAEVLSYPMLPYFRKKHCFLEGSQASAVCPSGKCNMKMNMEHWWNKSDRGKPKYLEKKYLSHCHSVHHKSNMVRPGLYISVYIRYKDSVRTSQKNTATVRKASQRMLYREIKCVCSDT